MLNLEKMWDSLTKENTGHGPTTSQMFCQQFAVQSSLHVTLPPAPAPPTIYAFLLKRNLSGLS